MLKGRLKLYRFGSSAIAKLVARFCLLFLCASTLCNIKVPIQGEHQHVEIFAEPWINVDLVSEFKVDTQPEFDSYLTADNHKVQFDPLDFWIWTSTADSLIQNLWIFSPKCTSPPTILS